MLCCWSRERYLCAKRQTIIFVEGGTQFKKIHSCTAKPAEKKFLPGWLKRNEPAQGGNTAGKSSRVKQ